ncbi:MAG: phospholipase [Bacteroidetes bacterium RIFOXYA12_FULL_35_11]|nr:MAG: phospholipase [Bacteroidetes bacterium GWF2_35_48]OFY77876.1 MAG: phospholipase [Bacteroidetes bacterium RIFOXYA12_FULL_35_11]OFY96022.1 MAG: phospholipase [Bacteroidetes bacterium RIFOXYC12_FULL_35_7]
MKIIFIITLIITFIMNAFSQDTLFLKAEFIKGSDTLRYRYLLPEKYDANLKYPLLLFLHGSGERGYDNEKQLTHCSLYFADSAIRKAYPCIILVPQCPPKKKWVEVNWKKESHTMPIKPSFAMDLLLKLMEEFTDKNSVDKSRMYVTGLSMGGFGVWDIIARKPDWFAAAVPVCGGADEKTAKKIIDIPVWAFHGAKDKVVKPLRSRNITQALIKAGGKPKYTEYPNIQHGSWKVAYKEDELFKWIFTQKK